MALATTGLRSTAHTARKNISDSERVVSALAGGLFVASAIRKRGVGGVALALLGAELLRRGATGHCMLYETIGFSSNGHRSGLRSAAATVNARKAIKLERTITIGKPVSEIYDFWRDFSNLSRVLDDLESVTDLGDGRSHWVANGPAGARIEWDSEIVNDIPGELIAWKTVGEPDVPHAGSVHFKSVDGGTEVRFVMDYEPSAGRVLAGTGLGESPDGRISSDLIRLKMLFETGLSP